ncbi:hypothetical protein [Endozoicomonas sp. 8E]|uniref:hypothetical protein n=1 Tax=Endozoicomonas sp. 8E TaxID=3035692 RepID=UPI00293911E2|nr:hypothetical protein [Endozoicomonas sp. 8E]WOG27383.1 hypothetical protein P6910_22995 [Endozoicomonas sp. 8E]
MRKSFNLFLLLLCLLCATAQARPPSQNDFDFLRSFNDTALVANGLELTGSIAGVSLSTLLNMGIWWGVCKTAGIVTGLSSTYDLAESDTKELGKLKTDFCLQLAPLVTSAEVALAGHVSPWPLEQRWWKPLYFAGAGMAAYATVTKARQHVPVAVLIYLASEAVSRTGASAISTLALRKMSVRDMVTEWYAAGEYAVLSLINGFMAGAVVYEAMIHKGHRPAKAILASVVSAAITGTLSGIISLLTIDVGGEAVAKAGVGVLAGAVAGVGVGLGAGAGAGAGLGAGATATVTVTAAAAATATAAATAPAASPVGFRARLAALVGAEVGSFTFGGVAALLMLGSAKITSNNPLIKAGITLVPALTFAVINSLSNYAIYGYPLEEGFSETGWTQWKKFYAPLDYLSTLFR